MRLFQYRELTAHRAFMIDAHHVAATRDRACIPCDGIDARASPFVHQLGNLFAVGVHDGHDCLTRSLDAVAHSRTGKAAELDTGITNN